MRVAAVDCGTNAVRLLVLERRPDGTLAELTRQLRLVRLGEGVDATGEFSPEALRRTFAVVTEYADQLARMNVRRVRFVATSAARDVANAETFLGGVEERLGVPGEIITGADEAALTFAGAMTAAGGAPTTMRPALVTDIGGGSTELVVGGEGIERGISLDIGSVRLRERFLADDPPTCAQRVAATAFIDDQLDRFALDDVRAWIGVAGTVTTMGAVWLGLPTYDRAAVQGLVLSRDQIEDVTDRLWTTPVADLVSPVLPRLRAEVIAGGALICARVAARVGVPMMISENDLLDGVAHGLLD